MKSLLFCLLLTISCLGVKGQPASKNRLIEQRKETDHALFFAVDQYDSLQGFRKLTKPILDADTLAKTLRTYYGFETEVVKNPTRKEIIDKIRAYRSSYKKGRKGYSREGQLLIFFSGHGKINDDEGYFIPTNGQNSDIFNTAVPYYTLRKQINLIPCKHILVAIDACFSGAFDPEWTPPSEIMKSSDNDKFPKHKAEFTEGERLIATHRKYQTRRFFTSALNTKTPDKSQFVEKFLEGLHTYGGDDRILTNTELLGYLETAHPKAFDGSFGRNDQLSSFLFIANDQAPKPNDDGLIELRFLHLNDTYEISPVDGGKSGGLAWVGTFRKQQLAENKNLLTVHAGDFLNPSLLSTLQDENGDGIKGKQMVEVFNALGMDLVNLGHHEFDLRERDLQARINESKFSWISGNAFHYQNGKAAPFYKEKDGKKQPQYTTYIWEVEDADGTSIKVGILALTIDVNPKPYVIYKDYFEAAQESYDSLKNKTDFVVGLVHLDREDLARLARMLPEMPLIMAGHNHDRRIGKVGKVTIGNADANARTVLLHTLTIDKNKDSIAVHSEFYPHPIPKDPELEEIIKKWEKQQSKQLSSAGSNPQKVIYISKTPLDGTEKNVRYRQTNLGELITTAMAKTSENQPQVALLNGGAIRIDDSLSQEIRELDIYKALPYGGKIVEVQMKGHLLEQLLNAGKNAVGEGGYLQRYGARYETVPGRWLIGNTPLDKDATYQVSVNDFLLSGIDFPFFTPNNPGIINIEHPDSSSGQSDPRLDIRQAVIAYLGTLW